MAAEPTCVEIRLEDDSRLIAGMGGAVAYCAGAAGLSEASVENLRRVATGACQEVFSRMDTPRAQILIALAHYPDRFEVALSYPGTAAPAADLESLAASVQPAAGGTQSPFLSGGVDRVQCESQGGLTLTRLTKYLQPPAPSA